MQYVRMFGTPVVLLLLLGFLFWGASWGWKNLTAPLPEPSPTPCVTVPAKTITPKNVTIRNVSNGGFTTGLAGRVGAHLKGQGFTILHIRNTEERVAKTVVRGSADNQAALDLVASQFKEAIIEHDDRVDGTVDVLVGTQYAGVNPDALKEISTPGGVNCEYPSPSPTTSVPASPAPSKSN